MRAPLQRTWAVMPEPKALVAVGTDACSGGLAADGGTVGRRRRLGAAGRRLRPRLAAIADRAAARTAARRRAAARGRRPMTRRVRDRDGRARAGAVRSPRRRGRACGGGASAAGGVLLVIVGLDRGARRREPGARSRRAGSASAARRCAPTALAGIFLALTGVTGAATALAALELPARTLAHGARVACSCSLSRSRSAPTTRFCSSSPGRRSPSAST